MLFARALAAGATEKVAPRPSPEPGVRFAFLADPEGNLVELVERREAGRARSASSPARPAGRARRRRELFAAEGAIVVGCDIKADGIDLADAGAGARAGSSAGVAERGRHRRPLQQRVGDAGRAASRRSRCDDWRFTLRNELDLIFTVTKAAWPHLVASARARSINTASVSAHGAARLFTEQAAHGAAKGGVLAHHPPPRGVGRAARDPRRTRSRPGLIVTPQIAEFLEDPAHPMHAMRARTRSAGWASPRTSRGSRCSWPPTTPPTSNAVDIVVDGGQSVIV